MSSPAATAATTKHDSGPSWKWSYDDYCELPADGQRHEIIDGEHFVTPAPFSRHQFAVGNLFAVLYDQQRQIGGRALTAPIDVVLSPHDIVQPDVLWVSADRLSIIGEKNLQGAPDLVIEVLSPSTQRNDEIVKRRQYERHGVTEYWTVDPNLERIRIYRRQENVFGAPIELWAERGDRLTCPLLPELDIEVSSVFE